MYCKFIMQLTAVMFWNYISHAMESLSSVEHIPHALYLHFANLHRDNVDETCNSTCTRLSAHRQVGVAACDSASVT